MLAAKLLYQEFYLWHLWNIFFPPALLNAGVGTKAPTTMVPLKFQILKLQVEYTESLFNVTFGSGNKIMITKFCVNQVKWYQFIQNQVKSVLVKVFLFHKGCSSKFRSRPSTVSFT